MNRIDKNMRKLILRIGKLQPYASDPKTPQEHAEFLMKSIKTTEKYFHQHEGPKAMQSVVNQDGAFVADIGTGPRADIIAQTIVKMWNMVHEHYAAEEARKKAAGSSGGTDQDDDEPETKPAPREPKRLRTINFNHGNGVGTHH